MPTAVLNTDSTPVTSYDLTLRLAPFKDAILKRTSPTAGIVTIEMDPRHAALQINLIPLGIIHHPASAYTQAEDAPTFAVVHTDQAISGGGASTPRDFSVILDPNVAGEIIYVVGLEPNATEDDGTATISSTSKFIATNDTSVSTVGDPGGDEDPLPTDVIVRKKRIPVPQGTGGVSSTGVIILVTLAAFIAGYSVAVLLN